METFIASTTGRTEETVIIDRFELFGEKFVVHKALSGPYEYSVSHEITGYGVPGSRAHKIETAKELAIAIMNVYGEGGILRSMLKAKKAREEFVHGC